MKNKNEVEAYGVKLLLPEHEAVITLEKEYIPANYGHQVWDASWLLIDYLSQSSGLSGKNIMDIGCGWGLAGIYCSKAFDAYVTSVDVDEKVQPFLDLIASINHVQVNFLNLGFHQIEGHHLNNIDVIIGSDICFCEPLIHPLYDLIKRVESSSVKQMIIADPDRWTFNELTGCIGRNGHPEISEWTTNKPFDISGKILSIQFEAAPMGF